MGSRGLSGTPPKYLFEFGVIRNLLAPRIIGMRAAQLRLICRAQAILHFCVAVVRMTAAFIVLIFVREELLADTRAILRVTPALDRRLMPDGLTHTLVRAHRPTAVRITHLHAIGNDTAHARRRR